MDDNWQYLTVSESNSPLPDYLPEDDITSEPSDKAVAPHGITETATNWISSAATFLQRSFYWWKEGKKKQHLQLDKKKKKNATKKNNRLEQLWD